ncbi:MAG TPA: hypothetical protein VGM06_03790 [Polyangiaceae bacterium]
MNRRVLAFAVALLVAWGGQGCAAWAVDDCTEKADCTGAVDAPADGSGGVSPEGGLVGAPDAGGAHDASVLDGSVSDGAAPDGNSGSFADAARDAAADAHAAGDAGNTADAGPDATTRGTEAGAAPDAGSAPEASAGRDATSAADGGPTCIPTGPEQCDDGIDNDCNGKVDCADPACGAYACIPPVPSGWQGPVALDQVAAGSTLAACPNAYESLADVHGGLAAPAAACSCACGASGQQCSATGVFHGDQTCAGPTCATVSPSSAGACTAVSANDCGSGGSFDFEAAPTPSGGTCQATVTTAVPPAGWTTSARVCAYTSATRTAGCSDSDVCVALPASPYSATACVYSTADPPPTACPAGYTRAPPAVFYAGVTDTRACGGCGCGGPTGGTCSGTVSLFGAAGCTDNGGIVTVPVGTACQAYSGLSPAPGSAEAHYTVTAGSCAVTAAPQPTGSAAGTSPTTVCCL